MAQAGLSRRRRPDPAEGFPADQPPHEKAGHAMETSQCDGNCGFTNRSAKFGLDYTSAVARFPVSQPWVLGGTHKRVYCVHKIIFWRKATCLEQTISIFGCIHGA